MLKKIEKIMNLVLSYEDIVKKFNFDLVNKLRKHGSEIKYLSLWVPDESFERSFESLLESVKAVNVKSLVLNVKKKYFSANECQNLIKTFPKIKIDEKEDLFIIFVQDLEVIDFKKKIEDKVSEKQQTIVEYSYGGSEIKENKKVGDFFKNFLDKNTQSNYPLSKRDTSLLIEIQNKKVYVHYDIKFNFIKLNIESTDKYILGCIAFFNKVFHNHKLSYIAKNGISDFLIKINNKCKVSIDGILLPFNFGKEVFFVNLICQAIFKKFDKNEVVNKKNLWIKKTKKEKELLCKNVLNKFLKDKNEEVGSISFNYIEKDINKLPVRVYVSTPSEFDPKKKPSLLRRFEKFIKKEIDESLQVFHDEKKDLNKIRRL
ncbi:MAG: hypothetical protein CNE97_02915 [alpha proteobacterium MED-G10]|nr:MAG: hypothetical protein CNE97_02915 [alpha proteobacterium MED-G10]